MSQIFGANMGSPYAVVDTAGRLYIDSAIRDIFRFGMRDPHYIKHY